MPWEEWLKQLELASGHNQSSGFSETLPLQNSRKEIHKDTQHPSTHTHTSQIILTLLNNNEKEHIFLVPHQIWN